MACKFLIYQQTTGQTWKKQLTAYSHFHKLPFPHRIWLQPSTDVAIYQSLCSQTQLCLSQGRLIYRLLFCRVSGFAAFGWSDFYRTITRRFFFRPFWRTVLAMPPAILLEAFIVPKWAPGIPMGWWRIAAMSAAPVIRVTVPPTEVLISPPPWTLISSVRVLLARVLPSGVRRIGIKIASTVPHGWCIWPGILGPIVMVPTSPPFNSMVSLSVPRLLIKAGLGNFIQGQTPPSPVLPLHFTCIAPRSRSPTRLLWTWWTAGSLRRWEAFNDGR